MTLDAGEARASLRFFESQLRDFAKILHETVKEEQQRREAAVGDQHAKELELRVREAAVLARIDAIVVEMGQAKERLDALESAAALSKIPVDEEKKARTKLWISLAAAATALSGAIGAAVARFLA